METTTYAPGLKGVIAARTRLSRVDGAAGRLLVAGHPIEQLAEAAGYEEVVLALWRGRRATPEEVAAFTRRLAAARRVDERVLRVVAELAEADPMDALRAGLGLIALAPGASDEDSALRLLGAVPTIVAAHTRAGLALPPPSPRPDLGHAADLLAMLEGHAPTPARARALESYLITVMDHGLNASTFAARVVVSTGSDFGSALVAAVGALKGPLHGGAPGPALATVLEVGRPEHAQAVLRAKLARGERLMGFGHRVYKVRDPRAEVLAHAVERLAAAGAADMRLLALVRAVENEAVALLDELKPGRRLRANVELYTALLLHLLGFPSERFTPVFAVGRAAGWLAHCFEQRADGHLIRPDAHYVGEDRPWSADARPTASVPVSQEPDGPLWAAGAPPAP